MKKESQNIEYKESWKDEYLKWICGFANAEGGKIYIGINDDRKVTGISDATKLLEDIPNKVRDILGIIVDVNLKTENAKEYLEICVDPYPFPVNYKGNYHYRTGSTKQELKGIALDRFLLQKQGKRWDGVPVPNIKITDLKKDTFEAFKENAAKSKRINESVLKDTNSQLIEDLHLRENNYLKRAAILLFHPNPEKYVTGAYIKIGYFEGDDDLKFQDEVHGNIFDQIEKATELLFSKYIKSIISYKGNNRIESPEYPKEAIREALLNAVAHKDYASENPIQISVYEDKIRFWNEGQLPDKWTVDSLKRKHPSRPFNPDIANALSRSGFIEAWGRGTIKMIQDCRNNKLPDPAFSYSDSGFVVEFRKDIYSQELLEAKRIDPQLIKILLYAKQHGSINNSQVQALCEVSKRTATRYLQDLEPAHLIKSGETGKGTSYMLKGPQRGQNMPKGAKIEDLSTHKPIVGEVQKASEAADIGLKKSNDAINTPKTPTQNNVRKTSETSENQRGHKGAKTASKGPKKIVSLDEQLKLLKQKISGKNTGNEIKVHFTKEIFFNMYELWIEKTLEKLISIGQKFNEFYTKPQHYISLMNVGSGINFSNEQPAGVLMKFIEEVRKNNDRIYNDTKLTLALHYSTFKKTNEKKQTFGCSYAFEIEYSFTTYKVFMDEFTASGTRKRQIYFEGLLHEPLPEKQIKKIEKDLGDTLLKHIEFYTKQMEIL